jgi:HPt (histidine-containing phosphotransfer) domain-containing protein
VIYKWVFLDGDRLINVQTKTNLARIDGKGELLQNLKKMFKEYSHEFFLQVSGHLERNEMKEIKFKIHQFKSSALNLGLERVGEMSQRIEISLSENVPRESIERMVNQLKFETTRSIVVLDKSL